MFEEGSGFKCGSDFFFMFLLECIDLGNVVYKVYNIMKVFGGIIDSCVELV